VSEQSPGKKGPGAKSGPKDQETWMERAVRMRVFFYIFGTHLFAGFVWLLFYLGEHANK
jgi:hypothetical protein